MPRLSLHLQLGLDNFDLKIDEDIELDRITALFGPSGAGKTTLLRILAGLEKHATGRVKLDDTIWQDSDAKQFIAPHLRSIGYVFQDGRLFSHLTVEKNFHFAAQRASSAALTVAAVAEALDLTKLMQRSPGSLSGGEQQRVAIGRALLRSPSLLLMDEPLSSLDAKRKAEIIPYIERLPGEFGIPILYVTHNVDEVTRLARRIVLLSEGRVAANGGAVEVLERIDLMPLAGHLEAGAVLEARTIEHRNGMTTLDVGGQSLRVPGTSIAPENHLRLRIQARDVALATQPPQGLSIRNILRAKILSIDVTDEIFAEILLDVGEQHLRARITGEAVDDLQLVVGQDIYALIKSVAIDAGLLS
jgi:molybdate transport system ATP-binding protein